MVPIPVLPVLLCQADFGISDSIGQRAIRLQSDRVNFRVYSSVHISAAGTA